MNQKVNKIKKVLLIVFLLFSIIYNTLSQTYHPYDKEGLRMFLRQPSAIEGQINAQRVGLQISDTLTWHIETEEIWVNKIWYIYWNYETPKRIIMIDWYHHLGLGLGLAGNLDCSGFQNLSYLNCSNNQITGLNVINNVNLYLLGCIMNQLTDIDVSNCPILRIFGCSYNQLTTIDVTNNPILEVLWCNNNLITELDLSHNLYLFELTCWSNQIESLDLRNNPWLLVLECGDNQLTTLDLRYNLCLVIIKCSNNQISSLILPYTISILECSNNRLKELNVNNLPYLGLLDCSNNQLTTIDLSNNTNLEYLDCSNNQISSLDLSNNINLSEFICNSNFLTSLDLSNNYYLSYIDCNNNLLTTLDLSNNPYSHYVNCHSNKLTSLNLNSYLSKLLCFNNMLFFSEFPIITTNPWFYIEYSPQQTIEGGNVNYLFGIDLSKEYIINGNITQFSWFEVTDEEEIPIELNGENGFFSLAEEFIGKRLRCKMTNATFPLLSGDNILTYEVTVIEFCEPVADLDFEKCGNNCVQLIWSDSESDFEIEGYSVYRNYELLNDELFNVTTFIDENLPAGEYEYHLLVHYSTGCVSDISNIVTVIIEEQYEITFIVKDEANFLLQDATVTIGETELTTNEQGIAVILLPNGSYDFTVSKDGYVSVSDNVLVEGEPQTVEVKLFKEMYEITFEVKASPQPPPKEGETNAAFVTGQSLRKGSVGEGIPGAKIVIDDIELFTNEQGIAVILLPNGDYEYTVSKDGYVQVSDNVLVEGEPQTVEVTMVKETFEVTFEVVDEKTEQPIAEAEIIVENFENSFFTDEMGIAKFFSETGSFSYIVTKENYEDYIGVLIVENSAVTERVKMTEWEGIDKLDPEFNSGTNYELRVFPNPTTGQLRITGIRHSVLDTESPANIRGIAGQARNDIQGVQVFDVFGRNVFRAKARKHEGTNGNDEIVLDISELPSGVYFLRVGKEMVKVVKK